MNDPNSLRQRFDFARQRHAQQVRPHAEQHVIRFERGSNALLVAPQRPHVRRMLGNELGRRRHGLLIHRRTQELRNARRLGERIPRGNLLPDDHHRPLSGEQHRGKLSQRVRRGPVACLDSHAPAKLDVGLRPQHVRREADEDRTGGGSERHLGGAAHDARQIHGARRFDRPLGIRPGHLHQIACEDGLEQAVPLVLLPRRDEERRAREMRGVERSHRVSQPWRHMNVGSRKSPRGAPVRFCHRDDDRFLQAEHIGELGALRERRHEGQLGGAGVAKEMRDALIHQQPQQRVGPRHPRHRSLRVRPWQSRRPRPASARS